MEYVIRQVTPEDLAAVARVEAACFPDAEAASEESLKKRIEAFPDSFYVAESDGKIIGFINGCVTDSRTISDAMFEDISLHAPEGRYQSVFGLDVLPEYRRKGVAAALMRRLEKEAGEKGREGMILTCKERLISYYSSFGYKNQGVSASVHGGAVWYDMIMEFSAGWRRQDEEGSGTSGACMEAAGQHG